ncbi:MAG: Smr/MutS family protein [Bacilli bacterium]|nr:Smr/MutS family protein [Bacilli bacterium]
MNVNDIFLDRLPKIDLHGYDRDSARVAVNDFINEAALLGYSEVLIIHGIGSGVIKEAVQMALYRNKQVLSYHINGMNVGCTVVTLKKEEK